MLIVTAVGAFGIAALHLHHGDVRTTHEHGVQICEITQTRGFDESRVECDIGGRDSITVASARGVDQLCFCSLSGT